jgi:hypothetical protein
MKKKKNLPINKNKAFQRKVEQRPRYKNTDLPDPTSFVDLMMETYPKLFEALKKN